jgi:hypothetical protein
MVSEFFHGNADAWAIWLISAGIFSILVYRSFRYGCWREVNAFLADEAGASYALPYLMTFPIYLFTVCLVVQSTMIMLVKIGTMHAAHSAARSAIVWRSGTPDSDSSNLVLANEKARQSAAATMTPFSSGLEAHRKVFQFDMVARFRSVVAIPGSYVYDKLYRQLVSNTNAGNRVLKPTYVRAKYQYAAAMTDVTIDRHINEFSQPLVVRVKHRMPIYIPGTGRILGQMHWSRRFYYRDVESVATLPLETPESPDLRLGIEYDSTQL